MNNCERCRYMTRECLDCKLLRLETENAALHAQVENYVAGQRANRKHIATLTEDLRNARDQITLLENQLEKERRAKLA